MRREEEIKKASIEANSGIAVRERNGFMGKEYNIDEIFGCTNVKVQAIRTEHLRCNGCFFNKAKFPYCFRPAFIPSCVDKERNFIFIKIN